jgi:hypothetical protein
MHEMRRSGIGIKGDLSVYNLQSFFFIFFVSLLNRPFDMARKRIEFSPCSLLPSHTATVLGDVLYFCLLLLRIIQDVDLWIHFRMGSMSKIVATLFIHSSAIAAAVLHRNPVAMRSDKVTPPPLTFYLPHPEQISNDVKQSRSQTCKCYSFFQCSLIPCVYI